MAEPTPTEPKRNRKRPDRSELPSSFLPERNPPARKAYIFAIAGIIPVLGMLLGPPAILFGWLGIKKAKTIEDRNGYGHAIVSILLGVLETISNAIGLLLIARGLDWL